MAEITQRPGKVAQSLGVSGMTLRNYVKEFSEFLSPQAVKKTGRRFTDQDVRTLQIAASILRDGLTYAQARDQLAERPLEGEVIEDFQPAPDPDPEPVDDLPPSAMETKDFYDLYVQPIIDIQESTIKAKDETIIGLKQDKDRLQMEISWYRLPWYKKLFRDPPE